jgi:hypothetical protein
MALTEDQLAQVRRMINEPTEDNGWTDDLLMAGAEAYFANDVYDLRAYAGSLWEQKAAQVAELANVSESGSSRSLSQIFDHYMAMSARFGTAPGTGVTITAPRSTRIVRPTREG